MGELHRAVVATGLVKRYKATLALDGFDLAVATGSICGLLGPNGAGKTTAIRILATLIRSDGGAAEVAGFDVAKEPEEVRYRIGLNGQEPALDELLSGRQNLVMFGRLYHLDARTAARRADQLLEQFDLIDAAKKSPKEYSGGMRRRLDLAASLIMSPPVLFLDEPTTGLDPRSRNEVWQSIRSLVTTGTTVLLTTQYLDEADQLADQIAVIDRGRVIADGTPGQLKSEIGGDRIEVVIHRTEDLPAAAAMVTRATGREVEMLEEAKSISAPVQDRASALIDVVQALTQAQIAVEDIALRRATLDEVFLRLTGHRAEEEEVAA
jgi:ABC-2 type transport system ATP-binding protein